MNTVTDAAAARATMAVAAAMATDTRPATRRMDTTTGIITMARGTDTAAANAAAGNRTPRRSSTDMSRPKKCRRVCGLPGFKTFGPLGCPSASEFVIMPVDEFETVRLIDREGMTQEECAARMGIARATVQRMYDEARRKMAECLVDGKSLHIDGGDFVLCDQDGRPCGQKGCRCGEHC